MVSMTPMWITLKLRPVLMNLLTLVLGLSAVSALSVAASAPQDQHPDQTLTELAALRWDYRVILVDARIPDAIARLEAAQAAIDERDILWFALEEGRISTNYPGALAPSLRAELEAKVFSRSDEAVFLIGKDGGLKATATHLDLPALFERIDAMPMRRREMEAATAD